MLPGSPASFSGRNRHLEAAFHSPGTTACLQATIPRSKLPTCFFDALPFVRLTRSDYDSLTRPGSPRCAQDQYRNPVALLTSGISNVSPDLHSPSGPFEPLRIKAFNPVPRRKVRLPSAPDCPSLPGIDSILLVPIPDQRFRLAKRQRLAVPQTSWNHCHHDSFRLLQSNENLISIWFSTDFIRFIFSRLMTMSGVLPVDKT